MIVSKNSDTEFLYQYLKFTEITNGWRGLISTGTQANFNATKVRNFKVKTPSFSEQKLIGSFFKKLDEKIELEEEKLENYKTLKKSLLQKMFI